MDEIDAMSARREIENLPDQPRAEPVGDWFWKTARAVRPKDRQASIHLRIDPGILAWFKS